MSKHQQLIKMLREATVLARQINAQWSSIGSRMEEKHRKIKKAA